MVTMMMTMEVLERRSSTRTWHLQDLLTTMSGGHISGRREDFAQDLCAPDGPWLGQATGVADADCGRVRPIGAVDSNFWMEHSKVTLGFFFWGGLFK